MIISVVLRAALTLVSLGMKSVSISRHMPSSDFSSPRTKNACSSPSVPPSPAFLQHSALSHSDRRLLLSVSILGFSSTPPSPRSTHPVSVSGQETFSDRSLRTPSAIASSNMFFDVSATCISSPSGTHLFVRCRLNFLVVYSVTLGELARGDIQNLPALSISALCPLSRTSR